MVISGTGTEDFESPYSYVWKLQGFQATNLMRSGLVITMGETNNVSKSTDYKFPIPVGYDYYLHH